MWEEMKAAIDDKSHRSRSMIIFHFAYDYIILWYAISPTHAEKEGGANEKNIFIIPKKRDYERNCGRRSNGFSLSVKNSMVFFILSNNILTVRKSEREREKQ